MPVRLVDRHLGEPAQQLGAPVGGRMRGQQFGTLLDEGGRHVAGEEVRILQDGLQEGNVRAHATDPELGQRPPGPSDRELEGPAAAGQLDQHRVEVGTDLHAGVGGAAVQPYAGPARGAIGRDGAGVGSETVGRVLGGDPALQRGAVDPRCPGDRPRSASALPRRDPHLRLDQVDVGDLLGHRVLDLDPRVHLDEDVLAGPSPSVSTRNSTVPAQE